jgi:hypothetical protein
VRERILGEVYEKLGLDRPLPSAPASADVEAAPEERPVEPAEQVL